MKCPKCEKVMYPVCSNPKCVCWRRIPEGEKPMINCAVFWGIKTPYWLFSFFWELFHQKTYRFGFMEAQQCPYCGKIETYDFWEELEMDEMEEILKGESNDL